MYTVRIKNIRDEEITLTDQQTRYQVIKITGLNPPKAQINTAAGANIDGAIFNSARLNTRNIVLTVVINGEVEENRQNLYRFFQTKNLCTFYFANQNRDVFIEGYVDNIECDLFQKHERMQISIICPQPYFKAVDEIVNDMSSVTGTFVFPFAIDYDDPVPFSEYETLRTTDVFNASDSSTGIIIEASFRESVSDLVIQNIDTGEAFSLSYSFLAGDRVIINTNQGHKSVTLIRGGVSSNICAAVQVGSTFFQLAIGSNNFGYLADNGDKNNSVSVVIRHNTLFRGV